MLIDEVNKFSSIVFYCISSTEKYVRLTCMMYPEFEKQCSPINAFVYPKITTDYDYQD